MGDSPALLSGVYLKNAYCDTVGSSVSVWMSMSSVSQKIFGGFAHGATVSMSRGLNIIFLLSLRLRLLDFWLQGAFQT